MTFPCVTFRHFTYIRLYGTNQYAISSFFNILLKFISMFLFKFHRKENIVFDEKHYALNLNSLGRFKHLNYLQNEI